MNSKPSSSKSTKSTLSRDGRDEQSVNSRLRRLKIEENLLLQSLQKFDHKLEHGENELKFDNDMECINSIRKMKDSFVNIKNLFDEVKAVAFSQELLAELEIDEIKKKVIDFETTLKSYKRHLSEELSSLKNNEQDILNQIDTINIKEIKSSKMSSKLPSTSYNKTVPSPVRLLMTSPLKCSEVQEFQDFMKNSPNRYGGWNEYHHNIFVKYWQKHLGNLTYSGASNSVVMDLAFENFIEEASMKLQGINKDNLISHIDWYKRYLCLKEKQQRAIDKWKSNRMSMRNVSGQMKTRNSHPNSGDDTLHIDSDNEIDLIGASNFNHIARNYVDMHNDEDHNHNAKFKSSTYLTPKCVDLKKTLLFKETKATQKKIGNNDIQRLMKPTKQWLNRNQESEHMNLQQNFIENLEKLRIPSWRQYL